MKRSRLARLARAHLLLLDEAEELETTPLEGGQREHARIVAASVRGLAEQIEEQLAIETPLASDTDRADAAAARNYLEQVAA